MNTKKKKKSGFTLIELVIVLAVLAIIALIAIPNFTKVRNESLKKADTESCNQIKKIALMSVANGDIIPATSNATIIITFDPSGKVGVSGDIYSATGKTNFEDYLKDVKKPQYNKGSQYELTVDNSGNATVKTNTYTPATN